MSTITDVARVAGVSVATVSRALRGLDRVSPATRQRVLEVAAELQYVASPTATSLASGRTRVVAVCAPFLSRWFFATLVSAIEKELRSQDHHAILFDLENDDYHSRLPLTQNMLWKRVDGIIALDVTMTDEEIDLLDRLGLPVVAIGASIPGRPCVRIDDSAAMRTAVEHLIGLGHRRIAYIGDVPPHVPHVRTPRDRIHAFTDVMAEADLPVEPSWVLGSDWTAQAAAADSAAVLTGSPRPTAIVAASDEMAIGVRETARRLGLRVPQDVSVVGIDDFQLSDVLGITTVRQDVTAQGRAAARLLLDRLLEDRVCTGDLVLPTELVVRESTGPAPSD
ncbi:LacI family DNA-binding transcriptional regulator [Phycicoccus sp. BSK3Z-2]|uniref:LacI family DNA-binding transcriptional regulator n=1 Tax=Phycicoccus avicenniae TaxID=2828860 RepID=A0A941DB06_9MICO|nr:LacI family DNA-binding transcriptional regulator [Phycicoccus avicenniae]MBR7743097.1 LacI family DNA-binding transcriptional regulator [Phycicoccus avicenniae]